MLRWVCCMVAVAGLTACTMPNPAFGDSGGSEDTRETGEPETGSSGSGSSETGSSETGSSDTAQTSSSETTDTSETGEPELCDLTVRAPLRLGVRITDGCVEDVGKLAMLLDPTTFNEQPGVAFGSKCEDAECASCPDPGYAVGALDFEGLAETWSSLGVLANDEGVDGLCVEIEANSLVGMQDGYCLYQSMGIRDNTFEHGPVFVGNVDGAPLGAIGETVVNGTPPALDPEPLATCSCASVHQKPDHIDCCEAAGVEPSFHALSFGGVEVEPGMSAEIPTLQVPWDFHNVQAQAVPSCDDPGALHRVSWALNRAQ